MSNETYEGLVVTTIKVTRIEDTNKCIFSDEDTNDEERAIFLKDIVMKPGKAPRKFEATIVDAAEAKNIINAGTAAGYGKPLFAIHGYNNEPSECLFGSYREAQDNFSVDKKFYLVPVVWACLGGTYEQDKSVSSIKAGKALRVLVNSIDFDFPDKSLLAHSMGNRVLGMASLESVDAEFDNIFLVAADIPYDIFHSSPSKANDEKKRKAMNIFNMLARKRDGTPKGKIYILHNENDWALRASAWFLNVWETRLGCVGNSMRRTWWMSWVHDGSLTDIPYRGYISNIDCSGFKMASWKQHNYQFGQQSVDTYESKYV